MLRGLAPALVVAASCSSAHGAVTATGDVDPADPTTWTSLTTVFVGHAGDGGLVANSGSTLESYFSYVGDEAGAFGEVLLQGAGTKWKSFWDLYLGREGDAALSIADGAALTSRESFLGYDVHAVGEAVVDGVGSTWSHDGLIVGFEGQGMLAVTGGGQVVGDATAGRQRPGSGQIVVDGYGSLLNGTATIGSRGTGTLTISGGGRVDGHSGKVGGSVRSTGLATVDGPGSQWTSNSYLSIGDEGYGTLAITNGGEVNSIDTFVGQKNPGESFPRGTGLVAIDGAGSTWSASHRAIVGGLGDGTLLITNGGTGVGGSSFLGYGPGSSGQGTVDGGQSSWTNTGNLTIGYEGNGDLQVVNGATVSNLVGIIGGFNGATGEMLIDGPGSTWKNLGGLYVGITGRGHLAITRNGLVTVKGMLTIDSDGNGDSGVSMATGGKLALFGNADDSIEQFLELVEGADAITYWSTAQGDWSPLSAATQQDYTLEYHATGELAGYTLLTITAAGSPGDFDGDLAVNGTDFLAWQRGDSANPMSESDLADWQANFGGGSPAIDSSIRHVPEPSSILLALAGTSVAVLVVGCRQKIDK